LDDSLNTIIHIRIRKDGDIRWIEKDLSVFNFLQLIRILWRENRNKEIGYFFFFLFSQAFPKEEVKKKLETIGITPDEFIKYAELEDDKKILNTVSKFGKNNHKH
jgi:hypothetical protein